MPALHHKIHLWLHKRSSPCGRSEAEPIPHVQDSCRAQRGSGILLLSPGWVGCSTPACPVPGLPGLSPFPLHLASVLCLRVGGSLLLGCQESSLPLEYTSLVFPLTNKHHPPPRLQLRDCLPSALDTKMNEGQILIPMYYRPRKAHCFPAGSANL